MYYVYVLKSRTRNYLYVGLTSNTERRLSEHNRGYLKTTSPYKPFDMIYTEECKNRAEARQREKYLKSGCGKEWIKGKLV